MLTPVNSVDTSQYLGSLRILQYSSDPKNARKSYRILEENPDVRKIILLKTGIKIILILKISHLEINISPECNFLYLSILLY
jgi:hypothetical protein